jgi:dipeptidyl aminopeptidase/acylaminoacyl peptidase
LNISGTTSIILAISISMGGFRSREKQQSFSIQYRLYVQGGTVTLFPVPTPTSLYPYLDNPFATPIPSGNITGTFVFQESSGGNIYTMTGDGAPLKKITNGIDPSWSPDGKQIAFTRWYEPVGLYVINADGTNETRVWNGQRFQSPRWNPDGKRIAFTQPKGRIDDITSCFGTRCFTVAPDTKWKIGVVELNKVIDPDDQERVNRAAGKPLLCSRLEHRWAVHRLRRCGGRHHEHGHDDALDLDDVQPDAQGRVAVVQPRWDEARLSIGAARSLGTGGDEPSQWQRRADHATRSAQLPASQQRGADLVAGWKANPVPVRPTWQVGVLFGERGWDEYTPSIQKRYRFVDDSIIFRTSASLTGR